MNWTTILLYVAIAFGGYLLGLLDARLTDRIRRSRKPEEPPSMPPPSGPPDALRLGNTPDGTPYLELDGVRLTPDAMTPEQRRRLINLIVQARPWIEGPAAPAPAGSVPPAASTPPPPPIEIPPSPPRLDLARGFRQFMEDAAALRDPQADAPRGIAELINDVLQRRLEGTPLAGREISLATAPDGSVQVRIGLQRYAGVDAVPDPEIRAVIRAAIAEWERSQR